MTDKPTHTPLPCPLCNSDSHLIPHSLINTIRYYVQCEHCGLRTATSATPEEALTAWNTRAVNSHHDLIEALEALLNSSGARGVYHASKHFDAVEAAESLLAALKEAGHG